jgi:hypothetical protein
MSGNNHDWSIEPGPLARDCRRATPSEDADPIFPSAQDTEEPSMSRLRTHVTENDHDAFCSLSHYHTDESKRTPGKRRKGLLSTANSENRFHERIKWTSIARTRSKVADTSSEKPLPLFCAEEKGRQRSQHQRRRKVSSKGNV